MSARPDRYSCQSWNVCGKVILQPHVRTQGQSLGEDLSEDSDSEHENVSESEVFVTALEDTTTALQTCQEDISEHSISETATLSDTLVDTDRCNEEDNSLANKDSDSSRTVQIVDCSISDTMLASQDKCSVQDNKLSVGEPVSHSTLPRDILDMCDQAAKKIRDSLVFENISGDVHCAADVDRLNDIIQGKDKCSSLTRAFLPENGPTRRKRSVSSSSDTILANESSLSNTLLVKQHSVKDSTQLNKTQSSLSETVCQDLKRSRNTYLSSSETLCIDETLSETIVGCQELSESNSFNGRKETPSRRRRPESSSSDTILANESSLSNTLLEKQSCSVEESTQINEAQLNLSETVCQDLKRNRNDDLSSSETLCIDETLSENVVGCFNGRKETPCRTRRPESSSSDTILANESSLSNTLLVKQNSSLKKSTQINETSFLSETACQNSKRNRNTDLSSSETLCISETLSETEETPTKSSLSNTLLAKQSSSVKDNEKQSKKNTDLSTSETLCIDNSLSETKIPRQDDSSYSETLQLDSSVSDTIKDSSVSDTIKDSSVSDTILDTISHQDAVSKLYFGKRPKSALFSKIKDRYEKNSSGIEKPDQLPPYKDDSKFDEKNEIKARKLMNQECLDNQRKKTLNEDTLENINTECLVNTEYDRIQSSLKSKHINVIGKLNNFFKERKDDDAINTYNADTENKNEYSSNKKLNHLKEIKTDKMNTKRDEHISEHINVDDADKREQKNTSNITNVEVVAYKIESNCQSNAPETDINDQHFVSVDDNKEQRDKYTIPKTKKKDEHTLPKTVKKDKSSLSKYDSKGDHNISKTDRSEESSIELIKNPSKTIDKQYNEVYSLLSSPVDTNNTNTQECKLGGLSTSESNETMIQEVKILNTLEKSNLNIEFETPLNSEKTIETDQQEKDKTTASNPFEYSEYEVKQKNVTDRVGKEADTKQVGENPFEKESNQTLSHINPFEESVMVSPRRRLKPPTSNARRDLIGGGNKNQLIKDISVPKPFEIKNNTVNTDDVDNLTELIQTAKRKEKITKKRALAESHIYEEIRLVKDDKETDISCSKDSHNEILKNHVYDEIQNSKEECSTKDVNENIGVLGRIKGLVVRAYIAVTPWWVARRMYWKQEKVGEEQFYAIVRSRRNSKAKTRDRTGHQGGEDLE
eukprot:GFUD01012194.1.p1 GENE.GFUD01012194.1~~GFUD01012194.1.p1  ORF type:complete len:1165 (-),score=329.87 GFUD01012194.1:205-3699(-)